MKIIAHRGGSKLGPENTIETVEKSLTCGADGVELDLRCSMDDKPVIMHDATVDRTTNGSGDIFKMNLHVLEQLDAGEGNTVPSLTRVLSHFQKREGMFLLELKHPATAIPTAEIVQHFQAYKGYDAKRIVVISFYHQLIALIKDKFPKIQTGALLRSIPDSLAACGEYTGARYILPPIDDLDSRFIEDAIRRNIYVIPWLCESKAQIDKARALSVFGAITPDPTLATG